MNLLPSGILRENVVNVMGVGMVIDLKHLTGEIARLRESGVEISPDHLKISDRATICMPYHVSQDCLEEERLADKKFGSTRRGIAPVYGDKYMKKALRMGDLNDTDSLRARLEGIVDWKNLTLERGYGARPVSVDEMMDYLKTYGEPLKDYIVDTGAYLEKALRDGKNIMFEAQLGALRDIDYGIYPYTSSSSTIAAYAPIGAGIPGARLDETVGIIKAYSTCVGEGPFTAEMFGPEADALRQAGAEYGAATGRPRRVGGFDCVASRYGVRAQGATCLALTKLTCFPIWNAYPCASATAWTARRSMEFQRVPGWIAQSPSSPICPDGNAISPPAAAWTSCPAPRWTISIISKRRPAAPSAMCRWARSAKPLLSAKFRAAAFFRGGPRNVPLTRGAPGNHLQKLNIYSRKSALHCIIDIRIVLDTITKWELGMRSYDKDIHRRTRRDDRAAHRGAAARARGHRADRH